MPRALVIGSPIAHSLSPTLHSAGYAALGMADWSYVRVEVTADETSAFVNALDADVRGVSVTMPCKEPALALAEESSALAREVGAANTLVRRGYGWFAENTDVAGVLHALLRAGCTSAQRAVILGSGATARSCLAAVAQLGVREVTFAVRTHARPETLALAETYDMSADVVTLDDARLPHLIARRLTLSTLPAGGADDVAARLAGVASEGRTLFDVVYDGWPTALAQAGQAAGLTVVSGLEMLIEQAAVQFELFTGVSAPIADMRTAGYAAVAG